METKHTVFSMRHRVDGEVELNGRTLRFENAKGYMEGDRGHSFPRGYTWIQSTDFGCAASVMLALAEIPLAGLRFTGCIGVVWIAGVEHRFATYRGVRIREASDTAVEVVAGRHDAPVEPPECGRPPPAGACAGPHGAPDPREPRRARALPLREGRPHAPGQPRCLHELRVGGAVAIVLREQEPRRSLAHRARRARLPKGVGPANLWAAYGEAAQRPSPL